MSNVILFAPRPRPASISTACAVAEPAQILFFTGVRYERSAEAVPAESEPRRRSRTVKPATRATRIRRKV